MRTIIHFCIKIFQFQFLILPVKGVK